MKTLLLMRHADAERGGPEMSDHARPLSATGQKEAALAGAWLVAQPLLPAKVICSTALRARQTLQALSLPPSLEAATIFSDQLYLASPGEMLQLIQSEQEEKGSLLLIGHNPGLRDFCSMFARGGDAKAIEAIAMGFTTAAIAGLSFASDQWKTIGQESGRLEFYRPPTP